MLTRSFIMLPGVGLNTELKYWRMGIGSWEDFLQWDEVPGLKGDRKITSDALVEEALDRFKKNDLRYFNGFFKPGDNWRLWDDFGSRAVFLDIETLGTRRESPITVVGIHDGSKFDAAVRGFNLDGNEIKRMLKDASMIVTFNGTTFDLPMIDAQFPGSLPDIPHLDLRFVARRCGFMGGLKSIEIQMGIKRPKDVAGMSGEDAVRLWKIYERDDNRNALKLILRYNREDIVNMIPMTEILATSLRERTLERI
ncbi:MAG: ribonuclease H-like domain-containing protein [Thermoplasmatota archaeon]